MKRLLYTFAFLLFLSVNAKACVIFIYHKVGDNSTPSTNVSIKLFKEQMAYLKEHSYNVISLKKLVHLLKNKQNLPKKCVVLTFDDGYKSIYYNAFPIIKKYSYPITVFLPTKAIEKHYPDYLTLKQIKQMMKYGVDFQSHSYAHPRFTSPPKGITGESYYNWIKSDIQKSIDFFVKHFNYRPYAFAIPYGDYNKTVIKVAKNLGFTAILTQDATNLGKNTPFWLLPRQPILGKYWSTMEHFKEVLHEGYIDLKKRIPQIGICPKKPNIVGGIVEDIDRYKKDTFMVYISELGWEKAFIKGNLVYIRINKPLTKNLERVGIEAKTKSGKLCKTLWMIEPIQQ